MTNVQWVKLGNKNCGFLGEEVELIEKRVYPTGLQDGNGETYRVIMRKCSAGYQCSHIENPCVWAEEGHDGRRYIE
ncbi:MAG: hypothetical protein GY796_31710 [Chloroflexi bacterium]|nr:hypothetical protein [Chloroflexota bacterium]